MYRQNDSKHNTIDGDASSKSVLYKSVGPSNTAWDQALF